MAIELKLVHGVNTVSLKASADSGWRLASGGWYPVSAPMGSDEPVVETINLVCDATSHDALATDAQDLDYMRYWAHRYMVDPTSEHPVWLHAKMQNETGERRALVTNIEVDWLDPLLETDTGGQAENEIRAQARISRMPWWQHTTREEGQALAETAGTLLTVNYTSSGSYSLPGDIPARLNRLRITSDASGAEVDRLWMGFRSELKHPSIANFVGVWECEDGTNNASESHITDDAASDVNGASPGGGSGVYVELEENDLDWDSSTNGGIFQEVLELALSNVSANEQDQFGDFLWMLRHQLATNATTWDVQLRWGYTSMDDDDFVRGPIVELDNTSWDYAEMGRQRIPLRDLQALSLSLYDEDHEATYAVQIWARRTSGAANLHLDCLCLIPIDEGWLKSWNFHIPAGSAGHWIYAQGPQGQEQAMVYGSTTWTHFAAVASSDFHPPMHDGNLYVLYAGATSHDLTVGISVPALTFATRWANLRGAEVLS